MRCRQPLCAQWLAPPRSPLHVYYLPGLLLPAWCWKERIYLLLTMSTSLNFTICMSQDWKTNNIKHVWFCRNVKTKDWLKTAQTFMFLWPAYTKRLRWRRRSNSSKTLMILFQHWKFVCISEIAWKLFVFYMSIISFANYAYCEVFWMRPDLPLIQNSLTLY